MAELEYKTIAATIETKAADTEGKMLHIKGYGAAFNNIDLVGDRIVPTALDKWLKSKDKERCQFCYQHDYYQIIGKFDYDAFTADDKGLVFEADLIPTTWGKNAEVLIQEGILKSFSIGYYVINAHEEVEGGKSIRVLDEITLAEISIVTNPANPKARLISAKQEQGETPKSYAEMTDEELATAAKEIEQEQFNRTIAAL